MSTYRTTDGIEVDVVHFVPGDDLPDVIDTQNDTINDDVFAVRIGLESSDDTSLPTIDGDVFGNLVVATETVDGEEVSHVSGVEEVEVYVITFPDGTVKTCLPDVFATEYEEVIQHGYRF